MKMGAGCGQHLKPPRDTGSSRWVGGSLQLERIGSLTNTLSDLFLMACLFCIAATTRLASTPTILALVLPKITASRWPKEVEAHLAPRTQAQSWMKDKCLRCASLLPMAFSKMMWHSSMVSARRLSRRYILGALGRIYSLKLGMHTQLERLAPS